MSVAMEEIKEESPEREEDRKVPDVSLVTLDTPPPENTDPRPFYLKALRHFLRACKNGEFTLVE